jgi:hypothetical protein
MTLPIEAARLVDHVVRAARLPPSQADRVRADLEAHFHDGLERRIPIGELIASFGAPDTVASLIRHTTKQDGYRTLSRCALAAGLAVTVAYGIAFARVATYPTSGQRELDAQLTAVVTTVARAERGLHTGTDVEPAFEIARQLTHSGSLWERVAGFVLLEKAIHAGDSLLTAAANQRLLALVRDDLRSRVANDETIAAAEQALLSRLVGSQGRMDQDRLRLLRMAKGFADRAWSARLLEPVYFSRALEPAEVRAVAVHLVRQRVAAAEKARQALLRRLETAPEGAT